MKRFFTEKKFSAAHMVFVLFFTIFCITVTTYAVSVPNTFSSGTTAKASEVNANFQALETAVTTLEGDVITAVNPGSGLSGGGSSGDVTLGIATSGVTDSMLAGSISPSKISGTAWTSTNDGSGSGLDADMVDGQHASAFITSETDTLQSVCDRGNSTNTKMRIDTTGNQPLYVRSSYTGVPGCANCGAQMLSDEGQALYAFSSTGGSSAMINVGSDSYPALRVRAMGGVNSNPGLDVDGSVTISGNVSKGGGSFLIDHPLDPENMILRHSFAESPDMINIYKGRAQLLNGSTVIYLPDYFDSLNHPDGREINLTPINGWSPLYLNGEITGNYFVVRTTADGDQFQEFSWVVYAERNDPYAQNNPIVVEEEKGVGNNFTKGECIHPEACPE